jgi:hypothetical protein
MGDNRSPCLVWVIDQTRPMFKITKELGNLKSHVHDDVE